MVEPDVVTGEEIPEESQVDTGEGSETEEIEEVTELDGETVVDYEELLQEIEAMSGSQVDYTQLLQDIRVEQLVTNQYLMESIEYQKQIAESMKLVNTFFYILFIFIVGVIGYKIMSWLI